MIIILVPMKAIKQIQLYTRMTHTCDCPQCRHVVKEETALFVLFPHIGQKVCVCVFMCVPASMFVCVCVPLYAWVCMPEGHVCG